MELTAVEDILMGIGKAFRLCRFYPASHPSVQQALADVSSVLPGLAKVGTVELRIGTSGFLHGMTPVAPRNPQLQELAGLLYAQGHRGIHLEPGVTVEEVATLIRTASSATERAMQAVGGEAAFEQLPHIRLARVARRGAPRSSAELEGSGSEAAAEPVMLLRMSSAVFRPDALPSDIEARRIAARLEQGGAHDVAQQAARLGELVGELEAQRDFRTIALAVKALSHVAAGSDAGAASAARQALECVSRGAVAGLVGRLTDASLSADERDAAVQALGGLGPRAMSLIADSYVTATRAEELEIMLAVVRRAGGAAAAPLLERADPDARGKTARAYAELLGATGSAEAVPMLSALAMHGEATVRSAAIAGLARIFDPAASRAVIHALNDSEPEVRRTAAHGIAWFGDASVLPLILVRLEQEEDHEVAAGLVGALGELRDPAAVAMLVEVSRGRSGVFRRHPTEVRVAAVRALGMIGTAEARAAVEAHLDDRRPDVRAAAHQALQQTK